MIRRKCIECGVRVGWISAIVDTILVGIKLVVGFETGSRALMADALYSLIDLLSALLVLGSFKISRKGADDDHAYGHGKIEFLGVAAVSLFIAGLAIVLLHGALEDLTRGGGSEVHPMAAVASLFAIGACFLVYRYARCAGQHLGSPVIITHAEHNKADAISSTAVLVSIILSWVGLGMLDSVVALVEIAHVLYVSQKLLRRGLDGLLDASPDSRQTALINDLARNVPGVLAVERVRARNIGSTLWVELAVRVSPKRRMSEVSSIREMIRSEIRAHIERVGKVMIEVLPTVPPVLTGSGNGLVECEGIR